MEKVARKLVRLKEEAESISAQTNQIIGKLESISEQLKKDFDIPSIKEAEKEVKKLNKQRAELESSIEDKINKLEKKYDSDF